MADGRDDKRFPVMSKIVKELDNEDRLPAARPVSLEDLKFI